MNEDDVMHAAVQTFADRQPRLGAPERTVACVHIWSKGDVICKQPGWRLAVTMKDCGHLPLPVLCRKCRKAGDVERDEKRVRLIERNRAEARRKRHKGPITGQQNLFPDDKED